MNLTKTATRIATKIFTYIQEEISAKLLTNHKLPHDMEEMFNKLDF